MVNTSVLAKRTFYNSLIKPFFDVFAALVLLLLLSPVIVVIALSLGILYGWGDVFFIQERIGYRDKIFKLLKFQTFDKKQAKVRSNYTHFLRKTGLDELPQLLLVLTGKLSLVGPRPLLVSYQSLYNTRQQQRHHIKPGITGYAQIKGRNAISWEQRFEFDIYYVEHQSFLLDLHILLATFQQLWKGKGNAVEMPLWKGNEIQ